MLKTLKTYYYRQNYFFFSKGLLIKNQVSNPEYSLDQVIVLTYI